MGILNGNLKTYCTHFFICTHFRPCTFFKHTHVFEKIKNNNTLHNFSPATLPPVKKQFFFHTLRTAMLAVAKKQTQTSSSI